MLFRIHQEESDRVITDLEVEIALRSYFGTEDIFIEDMTVDYDTLYNKVHK